MKKILTLLFFTLILVPTLASAQNSLVPGHESDEDSCTEEKTLWRAGLHPTDIIQIAVTKFDVSEMRKYIEAKDVEVRTYFCEGAACGQLTVTRPSRLAADSLDMYSFFCAGKGKDVPGSIKMQLWERIPYSSQKRIVSEVNVPLDQFVQSRNWKVPLMYGLVTVELNLLRF